MNTISKGTSGNDLRFVTDMRVLFGRMFDSRRLTMSDVSRYVTERAMEPWLTYCEARNLHLANVTADTVAGWMEWEHNERGNNSTTVMWRLHVITRLFRWAIKEKMFPPTWHPTRYIELPHLPKVMVKRMPFTYEQYQRVLRETQRIRITCHNIPTRVWEPWWYYACVVGWNTGLRISDVATLRWPSVNFDDETLSIVLYKTRKLRPWATTLPIEPELYELLLKMHNEQQQEGRPNPQQWVYADMAGQYLDKDRRNEVTSHFARICRRVGLPHTFHCFRHAFVARLLNAGVDPITVGSMTGQSVKTVQTYAHVSTDAQRDALAKARAVLQKARIERVKQSIAVNQNP